MSEYQAHSLGLSVCRRFTYAWGSCDYSLKKKKKIVSKDGESCSCVYYYFQDFVVLNVLR